MTVKESKKPPVSYKRSEDFFKAELREAITESILLPVSLDERQDVRIKPGFETACWSFQPPHKIFVGTGLFDKPNLRKGLTDEHLGQYVRSHFHHETAHGLYTERDMGLIKSALESIKAPFQLFNLMEDAVIEHRYRGDTKYQFKWLQCEFIMLYPRPESILFALIQAEGDVPTVEKAIQDWEPSASASAPSVTPADAQAELKRLFPRVLHFYERLLKVRSSMAVMPIINAWLNEFGRPPEQPPGTPKGMADMEVSIALGTNPEKLEEFEGTSMAVSGDSKPSDDDMAEGGELKGPAGRIPVKLAQEFAEAQNGDLLTDESNVDWPRAEKLAAKLQKLFVKAIRNVSTLTPSKRVSARHFAVGRSPYRKPLLLGRAKKKILLVFDLSGSMRGFHCDEGRLLVAALSILARKNMVEGHIVLSGVMQTPTWQRFELPMSVSNIERMQACYGAEGLEFSLSANSKQAREADLVFVYTDGQITDRPINKAALHTKGIFTWGLYAGDKSLKIESSLQTYFDKAVLRSTAEELVDAILAQVN